MARSRRVESQGGGCCSVHPLFRTRLIAAPLGRRGRAPEYGLGAGCRSFAGLRGTVTSNLM
jgi:hypothetical protein